MNGIRRGYVDSINPFNRKYVSRVSLKPKDVTCFVVFWTKNETPMLDYLQVLNQLGYTYYFQFTLTAYEQAVEQAVPRKLTELIETFTHLSNRTSKNKVVWRYDPILLTDTYTLEYHYRYFKELANS
ncbi:hypothetical protein HLPCO_002156 [Haloplasma contractile SSD-17B]|uniref:Uncharacterized protein n=1 Tax=Haloplasma contractile SSD-17B TaxID=1033810 RepID=U2EAS4_9MOLU|nr:hypothetical protein HLPCO_002156 [Haloplasma contractile SSD-17B]